MHAAKGTTNRIASLAPFVGLATLFAGCGEAKVVLGSGTGGASDMTGEVLPAGGASSAGGAPSTGGLDGNGGWVDIPSPAAAGGSSSRGCSTVVKRESPSSDVYVMLDLSSSMDDLATWTHRRDSWWAVTQRVFESLVSAGTSSGAAVGLQFFPLGGVEPESCEADYGTPEVPIDLLPDNVSKLVEAVRAHSPAGFTPTGPALAGAIAHMKARASEHPGRFQSVLLVTGTLPSECSPMGFARLAEVARQGYESEPSVRTYVIAMKDAAREGWNLVAEAGGTFAPTLIDGQYAPPRDPELELRRALDVPVGSSIPCRIDLTNAHPSGGRISLSGGVNLVYDSPTDAAELLYPVPDEAHCAANKAWYLETNPDSGSAAELVLCPWTCNYVQPGELTLQFGCMTSAAMPFGPAE